MIESIALLLCVLVAVGALLILISAHLMAESILRPPRMTDGKAVYVLKRLSPADLGLKFSVEQFQVRDTAKPGGSPMDIAAWWIPAAVSSPKCVVILHGYADAKVGSIAWAPMWHALQFNILAIDLRAHGESGGRDSTAGFFERQDVSQLLDSLRSTRPEHTRELVLFGLSMGGAVALATAVMRTDIAAVVIDSPYADYRCAVQKHLDRLGMPIGITSTLAIWLAQLNSGASFTAVRPVQLIPDVPCPVMQIRGENEDFLTAAESAALDLAMRKRPAHFRDRLWIAPGAAHLGALGTDPDLYARNVENFLKPDATDLITRSAPLDPTEPK